MNYFLGTCSVVLALVLTGAACSNGSQCSGACCGADCPCVQECPCNDGTTQTSVAGCGPTVCAGICATHGGAVDGGAGAGGGDAG